MSLAAFSDDSDMSNPYQEVLLSTIEAKELKETPRQDILIACYKIGYSHVLEACDMSLHGCQAVGMLG